MRRILTSLAALLLVAAGSRAEAYLLENWTLKTTSIGGSEIVQHIDTIGMNGTIDLVQNIADNSGIPKVGDTFVINNAAVAGNPIAFKGVSYDSGPNTNTPLLISGLLTLETPTLTGQITATTATPGVYAFSYNSPGAGTIKLVYTDTLNTRHVIANFDLDPAKSGGTSSGAPISATGTIAGVSSLSGEMHVLLAGVLFDSAGNDLAGGTYQMEFGALSGGYTYTATGTLSKITVDNGHNTSSFTVAVVPEPASLLLLGSGVLSAAFLKRKNRKGQVAA